MQTLVSNLSKSKLAFLTTNKEQASHFQEFEPALLEPHQLLGKTELQEIEILVITLSEAIQLSDSVSSHSASTDTLKTITEKINKVVLLINDSKHISSSKQKLPTQTYNWLRPHLILNTHELNSDILQVIWGEISLSQQQETFLNLATELNSQYEIAKQDLENYLHEKTLRLIKSRKQIFEINNRIEFLRRTLYVTSEVHSIEEAEAALNKLLTHNLKVTWLKIVSDLAHQQFESELGKEFESGFYKAAFQIKPMSTCYWIYFFRPGKKAFTKIDIDFFKKITETLQINLNRYANLLSLQKSERLFDLAFHSSPHYILIIDKDYQVLQANLAAEKEDQDRAGLGRCYSLLFNRKSPCPGCRLGERFQIQQNQKTFRVQSNRFNLNNDGDDDSHHWIQLYEDISEQVLLENKYQQSTRLAELGLISSSIAHELNNPLGGIMSYLQVMKLDLSKDHPFLNDIEIMQNTSLRMKKIIDDLLVFSRKENQLQIEVIDLRDVVGKTLDPLQLQLKKAKLDVDIPPPLQIVHPLSVLHFRNSIHLVFQFFLQKNKQKKSTDPQHEGKVEISISQDATASIIKFNANLGPYDPLVSTNDMTLISLEKSLMDQGFQVLVSEGKSGWMQIKITLPLVYKSLAK